MAEDTSLESVESFLQCFYYVFLPFVLISGILCFAKSVIRSTKFYEGNERLDGKTVVITGRFSISLRSDDSFFREKAVFGRLY